MEPLAKLMHIILILFLKKQSLSKTHMLSIRISNSNEMNASVFFYINILFKFGAIFDNWILISGVVSSLL